MMHPIETAPRDGRFIFLLRKGDNPSFDWGGPHFWCDGFWISQFGVEDQKYPATHWYPLRAAIRPTARALEAAKELTDRIKSRQLVEGVGG